MEIEKNVSDMTDSSEQAISASDFRELALFLARSYGRLLLDRDRLKAVIDAGVQPYTEEMAIRDLSAISIDYESERVQTSNISNVPMRVTEMLDAGYVEEMNRRLCREMDETVKEYGYICWKIEVVETAMQERMDKMERAIFTRIFVRDFTFSQLKKSYKKKLGNEQICRRKQAALGAVEDELALAGSVGEFGHKYMEMLKRELGMEKQNKKDEKEGDGRQ